MTAIAKANGSTAPDGRFNPSRVVVGHEIIAYDRGCSL